MIDLHTPDANQDAQNFQVAGFEGQDRIEARSALLNIGEVNACNVGNRLDGGWRVVVVQRYGRLVGNVDELRKLGAQIGVLRAAVAEIPTGIHGERLQVGQPSAAESTGRF